MFSAYDFYGNFVVKIGHPNENVRVYIPKVCSQ